MSSIGLVRSVWWHGVLLLWTVLLLSVSTALPFSTYDKVITTATTCSFPSPQLAALHDLYNITHGDDWRWPSDASGIPWNFEVTNPNPCTDDWQGITCNSFLTGDECVPTKLNLTKHGLRGHIPNSLGDLVNITFLDLSQNILFGKIPESLSKMQNLTTLWLVNCGLNGTLPSSLSTLSKLEDFRVKGNLLTGHVPEAYYSQLPRLTHFNISSNNISGTISTHINTWSKLEVYDIRLNYYNGTLPSSMSQLKYLKELVISDNRIRGHIPAFLNKLTALTFLDLSNNSFSGPLSLPLTGLTQLKYYSVARNRLTGIVPNNMFEPIKNNIQVLILFDNYLQGTIPTSVFDCTKLWYLDLSANFFNGTLSTEIANLQVLEQLYISANGLRGTLPSEIGSMTTLQVLQIYGNVFTGLIPSTFSNLTALTILDIGINRFRGSFPQAFCSLAQLQFLFMNANSFQGSLPACIGNIFDVQILYMQNNQFTGTIPDIFDTLHHMEVLYVYNNFLHGHIPDSLGDALRSLQIDMHHNLLTGHLPVSLSQLQSLYILYLYQNELTGSIPNEYGNMTRMNEMFLYQNELTGGIPPSLGDLRILYALFIQNNYLSQTIPNALFHKNSTLSAFYVFNNVLTGPLPSTLHEAYTLQLLNVSNNSLSSTFPNNVQDMRYLVSIDLSSNRFVGRLDNLFTKLRLIQVFFVQNNQFSGNIQNLFDSNHDLILRNVDISGNQFTGSLPYSFFNASTILLSFAAVKNCITGSIPESICSLRFLNALALDGLYTSNACKKTFFPFVQAYSLGHSLKGSIPSCLFAMKSLDTLHLSGNGITGSLHGDLVLGSELNDLSLSHNSLKGKIPVAIQEQSWQQLDLSFNSISGEISDSDFASYPSNSTAALYLQVNRLSGDIPQQMLDLQNINMLQGNMFSCPDGANSLPNHDPNEHSFQCGSNSINTALYIWVGGVFLLVTFVVLLIAIVQSSIAAVIKNRLQQLQQSWSVFHIMPLPPKPARKKETPQPAVEEKKMKESMDSKGRESSYSMRQSISIMQSLRHIALTVQDLPASIKAATEHLQETSSNYEADSQAEGTLVNRSLSIRPTIKSIATSVSEKVNTLSIYHFGALMVKLRGFVYKITMFALLLLMPLNVIFSYVFATYQYSYAWKLGYCYLSGVTPAIVLAVLLIGLFVQMYRKLSTWRHVNQVAYQAAEDAAEKKKIQDFKGDMIEKNAANQREIVATRRFYILAVLIFIFNCAVVLTVNVAYIYSTANRFDQTTLTILAVLVSAFKIFWGSVVLVSVFSHILLSPYTNDPALLKLLGSWTLSFLVILSTFNNVIAPCIATAFVSPNCFYYVIETPPTVTVSYEFLQCNDFHSSIKSNRCTDFEHNVHTTSYSPPFSYSYQCSSALINSYADVYIYRYFFTAFGAHLLIFILKKLQNAVLKTSSTNRRYRTLFIALSMMLPVMLRPATNLPFYRSSSPNPSTTTPNGSTTSVPALNPLQFSESESSNESKSEQTNTEPKESVIDDEMLALYRKVTLVDDMLANPSLLKSLFNRDRFLVSIITDISVMMTFGIIFPPIALVACINILMSTYHIQINIGRFVAIAKTSVQSFLLPLVSYLDHECDNMAHMFVVSIPALSFVATSFWSFAIFDTLGDEVGLLNAIPVIIIMTLFPAIVYITDWMIVVIREQIHRCYKSEDDEEINIDQRFSHFRTSDFSDYRSSTTLSSRKSRPWSIRSSNSGGLKAHRESSIVEDETEL